MSGAYARAINLLVQASRVSPPLRQAVAAVEAEVDRLTRAIEVAAKKIEDFGVCDCCNGCGRDGDGWYEPACVCDCKGECWLSVADSLRAALTAPSGGAS